MTKIFTNFFISKNFIALAISFFSVAAMGQVRIAQVTESMFDNSNLLVVSNGVQNLGVISYEYVVTENTGERLFVLYQLKSDGEVDFANGYNCQAAESIAFDVNKGRATRTILTEPFNGAIFVKADGTVGYSNIESVSEAIFTPYLLTDKRADNTNKYALVKIGKQIWMRENLAATTFADGSHIATNLNKADWEATKSPAYTVYDNDLSNMQTMGGLYNWYTVTNQPHLAPQGWQIPKLDDWNMLAEYISPKSFMSAPNEDFSLSFSAGELLKSINNWITPPNPGSGSLLPGNNMSMLNCQAFGSTSTSKFFNGYSGKGHQAYFWTSTLSEDDDKKAIFIRFFWDSQTINYNQEDKFMGYSVRCVAQTPIKIDKNQTTSVENITNNQQITILSANEGSIHILIPRSMVGNNITVYNMLGSQIIKRTADNETLSINTSSLSKGIYIIHIGTTTCKVII